MHLSSNHGFETLPKTVSFLSRPVTTDVCDSKVQLHHRTTAATSIQPFLFFPPGNEVFTCFYTSLSHESGHFFLVILLYASVRNILERKALFACFGHVGCHGQVRLGGKEPFVPEFPQVSLLYNTYRNIPPQHLVFGHCGSRLS